MRLGRAHQHVRRCRRRRRTAPQGGERRRPSRARRWYGFTAQKTMPARTPSSAITAHGRAGGERATRHGRRGTRVGAVGLVDRPGRSAPPLSSPARKKQRPDTRISGGMPSRADRRQSPARGGQQDEPDDSADREAQHARASPVARRVPSGPARGGATDGCGGGPARAAAGGRGRCGDPGAVTANRSWPTRAVRRSASSRATRPTSSKADDHEEQDDDDAGEVDPLHPQRPEGQAAERRGGAGRIRATSRTAQPRRPAPRRGGPRRGRCTAGHHRRPDERGAIRPPPRHPNRPTPTANRPGAARRAGRRRRRRRRPGRRRERAALSAPPISDSPRDRGEQHVAHLGGSTASGPPRLPERRPSPMAAAASSPTAAGPYFKKSAKRPASTGSSPSHETAAEYEEP